MVRIRAVGVHVGRQSCNDDLPLPPAVPFIRSDCWNSLVSATTGSALAAFDQDDVYKRPQVEYVAYVHDSDNEFVRQMTEPVDVFEFSFGECVCVGRGGVQRHSCWRLCGYIWRLETDLFIFVLVVMFVFVFAWICMPIFVNGGLSYYWQTIEIAPVSLTLNTIFLLCCLRFR